MEFPAVPNALQFKHTICKRVRLSSLNIASDLYFTISYSKEERKQKISDTKEQNKMKVKNARKKVNSTPKAKPHINEKSILRSECMFWMQGACKKGDDCEFKHIGTPTVKLQPCRYLISGVCKKGDACMYSHNLQNIPCQFHHFTQSCVKGSNCPYSHDLLTKAQKNAFLKKRNHDIRADHDKAEVTQQKYNNTVKQKSVLEQGLAPIDNSESDEAVECDFFTSSLM